MGIYQEIVFSKYGQHSNEALFYNVCISLCFNLHLCASVSCNSDNYNSQFIVNGITGQLNASNTFFIVFLFLVCMT